MTMIHSPANPMNERCYYDGSFEIHGFQQCCSAAILHGISGYGRRPGYKSMMNFPFVSYVEPLTFDEYFKKYASKHEMFHVPVHYVYCMILEAILHKCETGEGGTNMWASPHYKTRTWFIADRRKGEGTASCMNFMLWLKELGVQKVGRIHISPWADGAHGGECKGGVYTPNEGKVAVFLNEELDKLAAHAKAVVDEYAINDIDEIEPTDEVAAQW